MRTVLIVGAGGSRAQAASYRPRRALGHPPLDGDFFEKSTRLAKRIPVIARRVRDLKRELNGNPAIYDPWELASITMEQFFADIYYAVAATPTPLPQAISAFTETVRLYSQVLAETTNWVSAHPGQGDLDKLIRYELRDASTLTIITFNHDLIIESVAAKLPRVAGQWCLGSLYGDVGLTDLRWPSGRLHPLHEARCPDQPPFTLLKLHGSLNWFMRSPSATPPVTTLFPAQGERAIFVSNRADIAMDTRLRRMPAGRGRPTWYTWPLVVPPIYDKQRITGMGLLQAVWGQANAAIMEAERLVLFGYSLPDADVLSKQLLRTAVRRSLSLNCIDCINPDANVVTKLRQLLDSPVVRLYRDASSYLTYGEPATLAVTHV